MIAGNLFKKFGRFLVLVAVILLVTELTLRALGFELAQVYNTVQVEGIYPKSCYKQDSLLGYSLSEGAYRHDYKNGHSFKASHGKDGSRTYEQASSQGKRIYCYGGSLFYGQGLEDSLVFAAVLNKKFKGGCHIRNYSIAGHSMVSSLMQLVNHTELGRKPEIAIISYANYNLPRNVFSRKFRLNISANKDIIGGQEMGYLFARLDAKQQLNFGIAEFDYQAFPYAEKMVFMNRLERIFNDFEHSYFQPEKVDSLLLVRLINYCDSSNIRLVVANVGSDGFPNRVLKMLSDMKVAHIDISVDYMDSRYNQLPNDNHPNALAHEIYAKRICDFLVATIPDLQTQRVDSEE